MHLSAFRHFWQDSDAGEPPKKKARTVKRENEKGASPKKPAKKPSVKKSAAARKLPNSAKKASTAKKVPGPQKPTTKKVGSGKRKVAKLSPSQGFVFVVY